MGAAAALLALAAPLAAHEEGVIRLGAQSAAAGQELDVRGERLPAASEIRLVLAGALESHPVAVVRTDSTGTFVTRVTIPATASPGLYRVVAIAPDGDEVARADVVVLAAVSAVTGAPPPASVHPTDAMMELPVEPSVVEWALIAGVIGLAVIAGAALFRRGRLGAGKAAGD